MKNPEQLTKFESSEKPKFLYHGSKTADIKELEPQRRFTPGGKASPKRVYATPNPGLAIGHSFPWRSVEGVDLKVENGKVVLKVPKQISDRLNQKTFLYKIENAGFELTADEGSGETYHTEAKVKPLETKTFNSVTEGIEYYGGQVVLID